MTLHVFYRGAPGGNRKERPSWFSKWLCLASLLRSGEEAGTPLDVHFVCDGELPDGVTEAMAARGRVHQLGGIGNSPSYVHVLGMATATELPAPDGVYLVEDDYLHVAHAVGALAGALAATGAPGTYLTPYDNPDRYRRTDDLRVPGPAVEVLGGRHWRRVESANMTFATTVATLRRDRWLHRLAARYTSYPHDRTLWRTIQGLGVRRPARWVRGARTLLGPVPSLATHAEVDTLAPAIDWEQVADETLCWLATAGLPKEVGW